MLFHAARVDVLRLGGALLETPAATLAGGSVATLFFRGFRNDRRNWHWTPIGINGHERQVARVRVLPHTGEEILRLDTHSNFHRRFPDEIHARPHDHEIADVDWLTEIDAIDRSCDTRCARMPHGGHRGGCVHHGQNDAAEDVAEDVSVLRHHYLRRLVARLRNRPRRRRRPRYY
jgi:hypothetical protein